MKRGQEKQACSAFRGKGFGGRGGEHWDKLPEMTELPTLKAFKAQVDEP